MIPRHVAAFCAGVLACDSHYPPEGLSQLVAVLGFGHWRGDELVSAAGEWCRTNVPDGFQRRVGEWFAAQETRRAGRS